MPSIEHFHLKPINPDQSRTHRRLRTASDRLARFKRLRRLAAFLGRAAAVSEPPGLVSLVATPELPSTNTCSDLQGDDPVTVISANLWHDWPRHRKILPRLENFVKIVLQEKADIILLQEVARLPELPTDRWLAGRLGMAYVYSRANGHLAIGFEEGLAIFSRYPISELRLNKLDGTINPFTNRIALGSQIETPCGKLTAFSIHLGISRRQNSAQISRLLAWLDQLPDSGPVILGGDFNAHEKAPQMSRLNGSWVDTFRYHLPDADGTTHSLSGPLGIRFRRRRLDYIYFNPGKTSWSLVESRHFLSNELPHSDHHLVLTRLAPCSPF